MPKQSKILLLTLSVVLVITVFAGARVRAASDSSDGQDAYKQINVYSEVLHHIQADYVVDPNVKAVTDGALRGLLESLDADSSYLSAADYKVYRAGAKGRAQVGMNVSKRFGYATVVSVVPGSPADRANLSDGDILEAIGALDTRDLSLATIQLLLDGQPGSELTVSVVRPRKSAPEKVTMTRVNVVLPPVTESMYESATILYLKPGVLDREHVSQIETKLRNMGKNGNRKVLLDLRDVAAGEMDQAERTANFFLKAGTIASLAGQKVARVTFTADAGKVITPSAPLVVLVNRGTAGPGELLAAALADNKRGELVGERTFGEGAQTKTFELSDGAALILSVAKYETPLGKKLQDEGVTPGTLVAGPQPEDRGSDDDTTSAPSLAGGKPTVQVDDQLSKGLELLKGKAA